MVTSKRSGFWVGCSAAVHCCLVIGLGLFTSVSSAATTTYTDQTTFLNALPAGFYTNNFSGLTNATSVPVATVSQSGGTPLASYDITAPTSGLGVFPDTGFKAVGNWNSGQDMVVTFTSSINAAGGEVWLSDINGNRLTGNITVDFDNGAQQLVVPSTTTGAFGFAGLTSDSPITTMTIRNASPSYLNLTNLTVSAVPEPATLAAVGLSAFGLARLAWSRRRQRSA